jgi:hypothetical protein
MAFTPKKENTYTNNVLIGFYGSDAMHNQLKLLAVHKEVYMATIVREVVTDYLEDQPSTSKIIRLLAKKAHKEWDKLCVKMNNKKGWKTGNQLSAKWEVFLETSRKNLIKRKISNDLAVMVITELQQLEIDR